MKLKKRTITYLYMKRKTRMRTFYRYFETGKLLKKMFDNHSDKEIFDVINRGGNR